MKGLLGSYLDDAFEDMSSMYIGPSFVKMIIWTQTTKQGINWSIYKLF